ncbi:type II secretion system F family protein [Parasphingopyxis sp. CP4]|uniref:type II secretion system F family protein n=1 Tax=Parasphingopyxis sp. CP4 TaxID=2724527 RepID=UPI0015A2622B|nr:type II secretion system F family protein [Parasphingopyxis sp. CP4]QLC22441.1 type II secretion system F family protein [Parasphingopyxis sp. CP4]
MIDFVSLVRPILLLLVFLFVMLVSFRILSAIATRQNVRTRVTEQLAPPSESDAGSLRGHETNSAWVRLVNTIEERGFSLADTKDDQLREKLRAAGFTHPSAPRIFTLTRLVMTLALPAIFVGVALFMGNTIGFIRLYVGGVLLALLGLYLPNLFVTAKADRRREAMTNGFPDALDLMLVCVEAGLGLESAFDRVGREMTKSHPLIADMLGAVVLELRAGQNREDALRRMAERAGIDEIQSFATLMIQSSKLGSSIATTLRIYASEMREKRRLRAEEKAHRLPVLLSLPLVGCLLPVMIGILMLPAVIRVVRNLIPTLGGP